MSNSPRGFSPHDLPVCRRDRNNPPSGLPKASRAARDFLLLFMRYPEPGKVKTRLARTIGDANAAAVYQKLLERTLGVVLDFKSRNPGVRVLLCHTPDDPAEKLMARFRGPWDFIAQEGTHLGERMEKALEAAFSLGAGKAVLIGSDLADIEAGDLEEAFRKTREDTAVLGPARDGGFYLIGLGRPCGAPFRFSDWGTDGVFARTRRELASCGLRLESVPARSDVDRPEDLPPLEHDRILGSSLSVIVPTLSPPHELAPLLEFLQSRIWPGDEIILVQGGTPGKTGARRISRNLLHVRSEKGRGIQQNAGAAFAGGDILFFLHDDTIPPPGFPYFIRRACAQSGVALGCFRLAFCPGGRSMDLIARWANLRTALFRLPYGDQGLFCRRDTFEKAGGFRLKYLMEDVELVKRFRRYGKQVMLPFSVYSSPVRYFRKGILRASLQNHTLMLLFLLGVGEKELYSMYYRTSPATMHVITPKSINPAR